MRLAGVSELSVSERASPEELASKKEVGFQYCDDCCQFCLVSELDSRLTPQIDECADSLGKSKLHWTFDASPSYRLIEMEDEGIDEKAFVTHHHQINYNTIRFRLKNAIATFQQAMDVVLALVKCQRAIVKINGISILSK